MDVCTYREEYSIRSNWVVGVAVSPSDTKTKIRGCILKISPRIFSVLLYYPDCEVRRIMVLLSMYDELKTGWHMPPCQFQTDSVLYKPLFNVM
jgi:hypothetical protein